MVLHCKKERGSVVRKIIVLLLTLFMLSSAVLPVGAVTPTPQVLSLATAREAIAAAVGKDTPGAAVVLLERGELLMCEGFGYADLATESLVVPNTVFELGEISSLFVTLTALSLSSEGVLALDTDIAKYLPSDFMKKLSLTYPVTMRQLLAGGGGFGGRSFDVWFDSVAYTFTSLEEALLADVPTQIAIPGSAYSYSPFGITLAAFVLEAVTGKNYQDLATERVLAPLGMSATHLVTDERTEAPFAVGYTLAQGGGFATNGRGRSFAGLYPALGAVSSATDLSKLLLWLVDASDTRVLDVNVKNALFTLVREDVFPRNAFGFTEGGGFGIQATTAGFSASLSVDVVSRSAALVIANANDTALTALPNILFGVEAPRGTLPEGELPALSVFCGNYSLPNGEGRTLVGKLQNLFRYVTVSENEDGTLLFLDTRLRQIAPGVFANADSDTDLPVLQFLLDSEGNVKAIVTAQGELLSPLDSYRAGKLALLLFFLLLLLAAWFVLMGFYRVLAFAAARRRSEYPPSFVTILPDISTALVSLLVLISVLVAYSGGTAVLSSFYFTMGVLILLVGILALGTLLLAFLGTIPNRAYHHRVAITAVMFLAMALLVSFFSVSII